MWGSHKCIWLIKSHGPGGRIVNKDQGLGKVKEKKSQMKKMPKKRT